jgi:DUF1365 family protein
MPSIKFFHLNNTLEMHRKSSGKHRHGRGTGRLKKWKILLTSSSWYLAILVVSRVKSKVRNLGQSKEVITHLNNSNNRCPTPQSSRTANLETGLVARGLRVKKGNSRILTKSVKRLREN